MFITVFQQIKIFVQAWRIPKDLLSPGLPLGTRQRAESGPAAYGYPLFKECSKYCVSITFFSNKFPIHCFKGKPMLAGAYKPRTFHVNGVVKTVIVLIWEQLSPSFQCYTRASKIDKVKLTQSIIKSSPNLVMICLFLFVWVQDPYLGLNQNNGRLT